MECFEDDLVVLGRGAKNVSCLSLISCEGLLAEDMLSSIKGL